MARGTGTVTRTARPIAGTAGTDQGGNGSRPIPRRRPLPNGRAALGGLLIAVATIVLFTVAGGNGGSDLQRYVVARRPLTIGARIVAADLTTASMHVPTSALRTRVFDRPARLIGAVVVAPVATGELIQASAVIAAGTISDQRQISVPIESARALGDRLQPGELVDVVATFGSGADAFTATIVTGARVVDRDASTGPLGDRKGQVVVLSVATADDAMAVAHAIAAGQISLVRVSGAPNAAAAASNSYRAPRPAPGR